MMHTVKMMGLLFLILKINFKTLRKGLPSICATTEVPTLINEEMVHMSSQPILKSPSDTQISTKMASNSGKERIQPSSSSYF